MGARWKIILGVATLAIISVLLFAPSGSRAKRELQAARRTLRQQGFKVGLAEFNFSISPEVRKRAASLATTTLAEIKSRSRPGPILGDVPQLMTAVGPDAVLVLWRLENLKHNGVPDVWPELHEVFNTNRLRLGTTCQAACSGPIHFEPIGSGLGALLPYLADLRGLETAFSFRTMLALHEGDQDIAWTNLIASTCLVTEYSPEPLEISHLVRMACATSAYESLWNALQAHTWSDAQLAKLQRRWENVNFLKGLPETVACTRAACIDAFERERLEPPFYGTILKEAFRSIQTAWPSLQGSWKRTQYRHQGIYQDEKAALFFYRDRELEIRHAVQCPNWSEMRQLPGVTNHVPFTTTNASSTICIMNQRELTLAWSRPGFTLLARAAEAEARRRLIITAIALERHRLGYGSYPAALQELSPTPLDSAAVDFMDGKPLRYRRTEDGHFVLYSIGLDCVDDGGRLRMRPRTEAPYGGNPFAFIQQPDIIWPRPASPAEAEKFFQDELKLEQERLALAEESSAAEQWERSARRQAKVESILDAQRNPGKGEQIRDRRSLVEHLQNGDSPGTNRLSLREMLTLHQLVTGAEPETVTFELPLNYDAVTNIGELNLFIDPCEDKESVEGCAVGLMECKRSSNGNCLLVWSTLYESPGEHAIQPGLSLYDPQRGNDFIEGPMIPFVITNLCQFSLTSAHFQREYGVTLRARLPETNGVYTIEISSVAGELLKTFTNSTSNGLLTAHWDLRDEQGQLCTNDEFGTVFQITLPDSGRSQRLRGP